MIALDDALVAAAAVAFRRPEGATPTTRETISLAVDRFLPLVLKRLRHAGLVNQEHPTRRPRNIDNMTWGALAKASQELPLGQVELLRCCLFLARAARTARRPPEDRRPG
jgi:hypothetical protein